MLDRGEKIDQRAAQAIDSPRHYHVELAPAGILQHLIEARPLVPALRAAYPGILVYRDHGLAAPHGDLFQLAALILYRLEDTTASAGKPGLGSPHPLQIEAILPEGVNVGV